jgi:hypothetical protein
MSRAWDDDTIRKMGHAVSKAVGMVEVFRSEGTMEAVRVRHCGAEWMMDDT